MTSSAESFVRLKDKSLTSFSFDSIPSWVGKTTWNRVNKEDSLIQKVVEM
jgi:hypothetical protein